MSNKNEKIFAMEKESVLPLNTTSGKTIRRDRWRRIGQGAVLLGLFFALSGNRAACDRRAPTVTCNDLAVTVAPGDCVDITNPCDTSGDFQRFDGFRLCDEPDGIFVRTTRRRSGVTRQICASLSVARLTNEPVTYIYSAPPPGQGIAEFGEATVFISTELFVSASADPTNILPGGSTQLRATSNLSPGQPVYEWSSSPQDNSFDPADPAPVASPTSNTDYTVKVSTVGGDTATSNVVRVCVTNLSVSVSATPNLVNSGEQTQLQAVISGGTQPYSFRWESGIVSDRLILDPTARVLSTSNFVATVTDATGCQASDTVQVAVRDPLSVLSVTATPDRINAGEISQLLASVSGGAQPYTYLWDPAVSPTGQLILDFQNVPDPRVAPSESTVFNVTVTDVTGINAFGSVTVEIAMAMSVSAFPASPVPPFTIVTLEPTVTGGLEPYSYAWAPAPGLNPADGFVRSPEVAPPPGDTTYTVNVTDALGQTVQGSVTVTVTGGVPGPEADLEITKTASPNIVQRGDQIEFNLFAFNNGTSDATGVTVRDNLPDHLRFNSFLSSPFCTVSGGLVTCDFFTILDQQGRTDLVFAEVSQCAPAGTITNTATVSATQDDPDPSNNSSSDDIVVQVPPPSGNADREVTIVSPSPNDTFSPEDIFAYNIEAENLGPESVARGVFVTGVLPPNVSFRPDFSDPRCTESNRTVTCCFGELFLNTPVSQQIWVEIQSNAPAGPITFTVNIQADENEPPGSDPSNNTASVEVTIQ